VAQTEPYRISVAFNLNSKPVETGIHWARPNLRFSSSTPQKSKPTSPNRDFSPSDHKKLLNGNQLPKLWFLPISIGLLFAVTYPYCSLKLLFVHPARTTLRAFKSPISKATQTATDTACRRRFEKATFLRERNKKWVRYSTVRPPTSAPVILWHFITVNITQEMLERNCEQNRLSKGQVEQGMNSILDLKGSSVLHGLTWAVFFSLSGHRVFQNLAIFSATRRFLVLDQERFRHLAGAG